MIYCQITLGFYASVSGMNSPLKYLSGLILAVGKAVSLADRNKVPPKYSPRLQIVWGVCSTAQSRGLKFNCVILEERAVTPAICGHDVCVAEGNGGRMGP